MKNNFIRGFAIAIITFTFSCVAYADVTVNYNALSLRGNGAFGADAMTGTGNIVLDDINGAAPSGMAIVANPLNYNLTVSNQDLDGDGMMNDSFSFTVVATGSAGSPRTFNQGTDTGFGMINGVTFSVANIIGTTDQGRSIVFDGFTGADAGAGSGGAIDRFVEINGTNIVLNNPATGGFQFITSGIDFAPTGTVLFDNSGGSSGSVVARSFDLQFSSVSAAIPEPSTFAVLMAAGGLGLFQRRRK